MSCCKSSNIPVSESEGNKKGITSHLVDVMIFLILMMLMPFIVIGIIVILFYHIVLSEHVDLIPVLRFVLKRLNENNKKEIIYEHLDPEEYELMDTEDSEDTEENHVQ